MMVRTDGQGGADPADDGSEAAIPATNAEPEPEPGDGDGDGDNDEGPEGAPPVRRRRRGRRNVMVCWRVDAAVSASGRIGKAS